MIEARILKLTGDLIEKGVPPSVAATEAAKIILHSDNRPWLTPDETAERTNVSRKVIERELRAGTLKGAKKFGGQWRIPAIAVLPEVKG
jgi:excisionase family DNA binding protein